MPGLMVSLGTSFLAAYQAALMEYSSPLLLLIFRKMVDALTCTNDEYLASWISVV